jgi:putative DNA primase/helicase
MDTKESRPKAAENSHAHHTADYEAIDAFRDAIAGAGLTPPDQIIADGGLHRFSSNGKRGDDSGWYVVHLNGRPAGAFGDWRSDVNETWTHRNGREYTPAEKAEHRRRMEEVRRLRAAEEARRHAEAAERAAALWSGAGPADPAHAYLKKKGVAPHGVRQAGDLLLVPVRIGGELRSLQTIPADGGKKLFLSDGEVRGGYYSIGGKPEAELLICEGFATGASLFEATGYPVAIAFSAGNLEAVARALRAKYPGAKLVICADSDDRTDGNPGITKATTAARAVGGLIAVPDFGDDRPDGATDFNDLARHRGAGAVRAAVDRAQAPGIGEHGSGTGSDVENESAGPVAIVVRVSDVRAEPISWLWPGRIAIGKVTLISGDPGLGKSLISIAIAAHVTRGTPWLVDASACPAGAVLMLSAEDDVADTIRPRLEAAGADVERVQVLTMIRDVERDGTLTTRGLSLRRDLAVLDDLLHREPDVRLVVVDPISAYLGDTDSHNNADVRGLFAPLAELASRRRIAIVAVSHLNKSSGPAVYRTSGSLAFVAAARAVFAVAKDQDDPDRRLVLPVKNNLGPDRTGLAYRVRGEQNRAPVIEWEPESVTVTADEAMRPANDEERTATDEAMVWLRKRLTAGPMLASEAQKEARQAGISGKALRTARERLGIKSVKRAFSSGWDWSLPRAEDALKAEDALPIGKGTLGGEGILGPLTHGRRARYDRRGDAGADRAAGFAGLGRG